MTQHCYYITASYFLDKQASDVGHRTQRNFKVFSDKKGEALANELEDSVRDILHTNIEGVDMFNLSIDNIFDCGEVDNG